jgi:hypothetical protein
MKAGKETLYFVGHKGQMQALEPGNANTMYIPDSNLVLALVQSNHKEKKLPGRHKHFLSVSKQAVVRSWHQNQQWIPINPILALMELTRQNVTPNYESYIKLYKEFFEEIYGVQDVAAEWVVSTYLAALKTHMSTHPSISRTIEAVYSFCPSEDKPTDSAAIESCEKFFNWIWEERAYLTLIGGPLMYLAVYALCGSPQARAFMKYSKRSAETAKNVAWDLLYWVMLEIDYHQGKYENTVVCTSDYALAELLASRVNRGPRGQVSTSGEASSIESYGDFCPVKLKRLENTKLEKEIFRMLAQLLTALELVEENSIKLGFNELYAA